MKKFITENEEQTLYDENGVKRSFTTRKKIVAKEDQEPYYMTFLKCVGWIYNLKSGTTLQVLCKLLEYAEYETGTVLLPASRRSDIMDQLHITKSTLTQSIKQLLESDAIRPAMKTCKDADGNPIVIDGKIQKSPKRGEYIINPNMFWKGSLKRRGDFRIIFESDYDTSGMTVDPDTGEIK